MNSDTQLFLYWSLGTVIFGVLLWLVIDIPETRNGFIYFCIAALVLPVLGGLYCYGSYALELLNNKK